MSTEVKRRRGTTVEHATFTGAEGEITVDTTKGTAVVHDGQTPGGHPLAKSSDLAGITPASIGAATAAQGTKADSALQSVNLGYVASSRTITNTGGQDVVLPVFSGTEAGMVPSAAGAGSTDVLQADGQWVTPSGGGGGLTSVGFAAPAGFAVVGSPLTANGTITLSFASGYSLPTTSKQTYWDGALRSVDLTYTAATRTIGNTGGQDVVLPVFSATAAGLVPSATGANASDVLRADGTWGAGGGGLTSVGLVVPTGFAVSGSPLTANGNITLSFASGYSLPTDAEQMNWDVAATLAGTAVQPSVLAAAIASITPASIGAATKPTVTAPPATTLDLQSGINTYFKKTINGNTTFTLSNVPSGQFIYFLVEISLTSGSITWFSNIAWQGGTVPSNLATNKTHVFGFSSSDNGSNWLGFVLEDF